MTIAKDGTPITADAVHAAAIADYGEDKVDVYALANTYESMQHMGKRKEGGVWYTPQPIAAAMSRLGLGQGIRQVGPEPHQILRLIACDPACGVGPFLIEGARFLAAQYAGRLIGADPTEDLVDAVLPKVILECVFGMDIDPVAVDLAKLALSLETGGTLTSAALDRHIICGNPLEGASPPAMEEKLGPSAPMPAL